MPVNLLKKKVAETHVLLHARAVAATVVPAVRLTAPIAAALARMDVEQVAPEHVREAVLPDAVTLVRELVRGTAPLIVQPAAATAAPVLVRMDVEQVVRELAPVHADQRAVVYVREIAPVHAPVLASVLLPVVIVVAPVPILVENHVYITVTKHVKEFVTAFAALPHVQQLV